jgi:predicted NAD-dependent protein-ADP-ribosyltransferase YbiA (DUF1768 family)
MKIEVFKGKIAIVPESNADSELIQSIIQDNEHLIFQLQKEQESISLVKLGAKETVCNEAINVLYSSESDSISLISNLGHTPFEMDNVKYESVEAFWQSLKFEEGERAEVIKLFGKKAKKIGKKVEYKKHIKYQGAKIRVGSPEHWELMKKACMHKFSQNEPAKDALLQTGIRPLYHKPRKDSKAIPGPIMSGIWMDIRSELRREQKLRSIHLDLLN